MPAQRDSTNWRESAHIARQKAAMMVDPEACRMMLEVAADYDQLAEHGHVRLLEKRQARGPVSNLITSN